MNLARKNLFVFPLLIFFVLMGVLPCSMKAQALDGRILLTIRGDGELKANKSDDVLVTQKDLEKMGAYNAKKTQLNLSLEMLLNAYIAASLNTNLHVYFEEDAKSLNKLNIFKTHEKNGETYIEIPLDLIKKDPSLGLMWDKTEKNLSLIGRGVQLSKIYRIQLAELPATQK